MVVFYGDTVQFSAQVFNTHDTRVAWAINGIDGGNDSLGTVDTLGKYIAPASAPSFDQVMLKAISQADTSKSDSATILILDPIYVYVDSATGDDDLGSETSAKS